ncbi:hypothetical protein NM208_g5891 [Fusarium decemcellulare]|uniref:Uncharacterized protein n=1 Tax=Fusarium decemcellulare TaxID=57161 RepID=A0ACC1SF58_9HYPO|nr:hypothetical protein NM208_g5891 [Fusarium decemcellulare]
MTLETGSQQHRPEFDESGDERTEKSPIARLTGILLALFRKVLVNLSEQPNFSRDIFISLDRSRSCFVLWSDGYGIANGNLDDKLRQSRNLRQVTTKSLVHISHTLVERLISFTTLSNSNVDGLCAQARSIVQDDLFTNGTDDSSSDTLSDFGIDNLYEVAEDLKTDVECLMQLDPIIRNPVMDLDKEATMAVGEFEMDVDTSINFLEEENESRATSILVEIEKARDAELTRLHATAFELTKGDTIVFIDYPVITQDAKTPTDCNGIMYRSQVFRVHSENLLKTGSLKFAELLSPPFQARVLRQRKLAEELPDGVNYVLDLTPPSEGDELLSLVDELFLTQGIINWWSSSMLHQVNASLVTGHDDVCVCGKLWNQPGEEWSQIPELQLPVFPFRMKAIANNELYDTPDYRHIPGYCSIRHRNGLIRLLQWIEGKPASLDSAPRVWTLAKLSKWFDCTGVVRKLVNEWIMDSANALFIEVLPEEALRIAFDLELPLVARASFRILVNEFALKFTSPQTNTRPAQTTIFGRRVGELPGKLEHFVQLSAVELVKRVSGTVAKLLGPVGPATFDDWNMEEWERLKVIEQLARDTGPWSLHLSYTLQRLRRDLIDGIFPSKSHDYKVRKNRLYREIDEARATYVLPSDFESTEAIISRLKGVQYFLCSFYYKELAARLEQPLFDKNATRAELYRSQAEEDDKDGTFEQRIEHLRYNFQRFVDKDDPSQIYNQKWKPLFDEYPRRRFIKHVPQIRSPLVSLDKLENNVRNVLQPISNFLRHGEIGPPPVQITHHLFLSLDDKEMGFLPPWAVGHKDKARNDLEEFVPQTETEITSGDPRSSSVTGEADQVQASRKRKSKEVDFSELESPRKLFDSGNLINMNADDKWSKMSF